MRHPQLLIYETDGRLAALLRDVARAHRWSLREPRQTETCVRLLARGGPAVLVLKLSRDPVRELRLLDQVTWTQPETATVVVLDRPDDALAGLGWDLGARLVLTAAQAVEWLRDVMSGLLFGEEGIVPEPSPGNTGVISDE
jgi:hypothetical protein